MPVVPGEFRATFDSSGILTTTVGIFIIRRTATPHIHAEEDVGGNAFVYVGPVTAAIVAVVNSAVGSGKHASSRVAHGPMSRRAKNDCVMVPVYSVARGCGRTEVCAAISRQVQFLKSYIDTICIYGIHADRLIVAALTTTSTCPVFRGTRGCARLRRPVCAAIRRLE